MAATTAPPPAPPGATTAASPPSGGGHRAYAFRFERGQTKNGVNANAVGNALEFLRERDGVASAREFVNYSRPDYAETHPLFEWDDRKAAEEYRIVQARETIRELRIVPTGPEAPEAQGPVYIHVRQAQTPINGYAPAWVVIQRPDWNEQAKTECMTQLVGLQRRYRFLDELNPIWNAILAYTNGQDPTGPINLDEESGVTDSTLDELPDDKGR